MTSTTPEAHLTPARTWLRWLLSLAAAAAMSVHFWQQWPGAAYPTDLTRVCSGTATLVLMHDHGFVASGEVMERMNHLYADDVGGVDFLLANLKTPTGTACAQRHGVPGGRHRAAVRRRRPSRRCTAPTWPRAIAKRT